MTAFHTFAQHLEANRFAGKPASVAPNGKAYRVKIQEDDSWEVLEATGATPQQKMNGATEWTYHRAAKGEPGWSLREAIIEAILLATPTIDI